MATILESDRETSRRIALTIHPDGKPHAPSEVIAEYRETILREAADRAVAEMRKLGPFRGDDLRNAIMNVGDYK